MAQYIGKRLLLTLPLVVIVTFFVFALIDLAPGDPAKILAGENATPQRVQQIRKELHLDDGLFERYGRWAGDAVQGDLGHSLVTSEPVTDVIERRLPVTLSLVLVGVSMAVVAALGLGVAAAMHPGKFVDRAVTSLAALGLSIPSFWLGIVLVLNFAVYRKWFPALGYSPIAEGGVWQWLYHLILPGIALATVTAAELALQLKAALIETMKKDYILVANAKGLSRGTIVRKHALKNAAIPVVTVLGFRLAQILGGTIVIETVFNLPGLGTLAVNSTLGRDVPVLLGLVAFMTVLVAVINLAVDLSYGYFNPKVRT
jgi:peptide/nickel transport system permease protein